MLAVLCSSSISSESVEAAFPLTASSATGPLTAEVGDLCDEVLTMAGRYIDEGFVAGGGMERLARTLPPIVPASANLLFRLATVEPGELDNSVCEENRPRAPAESPVIEVS